MSEPSTAPRAQVRSGPYRATILILVSVLLWGAVWGFWFVTTRSFHPTLTLALLVTTSLVVAYAAAAGIHHQVLIPRWLANRRWIAYAIGLSATMLLLTGLALVIIRIGYESMLGPDPDPYGAIKHFGIDLFGMAVHLLAAAGVIAVLRRFVPSLFADRVR